MLKVGQRVVVRTRTGRVPATVVKVKSGGRVVVKDQMGRMARVNPPPKM